MKKICKEVYLIVQKFVQSMISISCVLFFSKRLFSDYGKKNLIEQTVSKKCIILGNGPSLNKVLSNSFDALSNFDADIYVVNLFSSSKYYRLLKPKFHVLTDPGFFSDTSDRRLCNVQSKFLEGLACVNWDLTLLVPFGARGSKLLNNIIESKKVKVSFYNYTPVSGFKTIEYFIFDRMWGMPVAMNVLCASLMLSIGFGYKECYLLGADHNWLKDFRVDDNNNLILGDKHFYGEEDVKLGKALPLDQWIYNQYVGFNTHRRISEYAKYKGVKIYNATRGSYIDSYERKYII